jgi:hypothetical protein
MISALVPQDIWRSIAVGDHNIDIAIVIQIAGLPIPD